MTLIQKKLGRGLLLALVLFLIEGLGPAHGLSQEKTFRNSLGMEFVLIPAGSFTMGSPPDETYRDPTEIQHQVTLSRPFYMQVTEVTVMQWRALMGKTFFSGKGDMGSLPVVRVSWHDCILFIEKLNSLRQGTYRLPTEAEWEYAARAGSVTAFYWGNTADCDKAMFSNNRGKEDGCRDYIKSKKLPTDGPAPVRSYPPNAWGLYDMHGNVWEWTLDWYDKYPTAPVTDPTGPQSGTFKVRRGGSWFGSGQACRSANRAYAHPASKFRTTGLRVVREVP